MRLLLLIYFLATWANAATYFVDFDGGSDSNSGTSSGAPFKYAPGDRDASGTAAATTLVAGDTVRFKGGVTYVSKQGFGYVNIGTAGTPITFDATGAGYGTGQAILTSTNADVYLAAFTNCTDIVWNGGMITNVSGFREDDPIWSSSTPPSSYPFGVGLHFFRSTNLTVVNLTISEVGQWQNAAPMDGTTSVTGVGVNFRGCSNVVMAFCDITRTHTGIAIKADTMSSAITIRSNVIHNYVNWGMDITPGATGALIERIDIAYNVFRDTREFDNNRWGGTGDSPHNNKIFARAVGVVSTWTNNAIHHNWFFDDDETAAGGTSQVFLSKGPSFDIYCNLFSGEAANGNIQLGYAKAGPSYQKVRIWNNTFMTTARPFSSGVAAFNADVLIVANNAIYRRTSINNNSLFTLDTNALWQSSESFCDYNLTFSDYSPIASYYAYSSGGLRTLLSWQGYILMDSNSFQADPKFVYTSGSPSTWDLRPLATSPLLGAGTNLTAIVGSGFTDYDGTAFPTSGPWPIGAFISTNSFSLDPEVISATISSDGSTVSVGYNQAVYEGSGGGGGMVAAMTLGSVTLTYSSGSGSSTHLFNTSRTIYSTETGPLAYTQPGDGFENLDGTDLASFTGLTISNGSGQQQPAPSGTAEKVNRIKRVKTRPSSF